MNRIVYPLLLTLSLLTVPAFWAPVANAGSPVTVVLDEEYDRYRKQGDDFYKQGKYADARRRYLNCLEVPGYENDDYAKGQIDKCNTGLSLRKRADEALAQEKGLEALELYGRLLALNPDDAETKVQLADYYEREGNRQFNQKQYAAAKGSYKRALQYTTTRQETLDLQLKAIDNALYAPPPKRIGLKLVTGTVALGAGVYALLLRSDYQSKLNALNQASQKLDADNDGLINTQAQFQEYDAAYKAAEAAQQKNGLFKACIGVAAIATLAEVYLLVRKPKARPRSQALRWQPASQSWGLAVQYRF